MRSMDAESDYVGLARACWRSPPLVSGCALQQPAPSVAELKYNPGRYQDKTVAIDGVVTSSWGVPLVPFKLYKVDDGTGEMTVVSQDGRVPTQGAHVRVTGRVSEVGDVRRTEPRAAHPSDGPGFQGTIAAAVDSIALA